MWFDKLGDGAHAQLTYVIYGNDTAPGNGNFIMYNLDRAHGMALSANITRYVGKSSGWFKANLVDHQVKYILTMLKTLTDSAVELDVQTNWLEVYKMMASAAKLSIRLLVVDGRASRVRRVRSGAVAVEWLRHRISRTLGSGKVIGAGCKCNDSYVYQDTFTRCSTGCDEN